MDDFIMFTIVIGIIILYGIKLSLTHKCDDCGRKNCRCNE